MSVELTESARISTNLEEVLKEAGVEYEEVKRTKTTVTISFSNKVADSILVHTQYREDIDHSTGKYKTDLANVKRAIAHLADSAQDVASFDLKQHKLGKIIPKMTDDEFIGLADSIESQGFLDDEPIIIHEGRILDGWHRYKACLDLKITPAFRDYKGDDPKGYVIAKNLERRHLTDDQRAAAAEAMADAGVGKRGSDSEGTTLSQAATAMAASAHKVKRARAVANAVPAAAEAVKSGEISLSEAERITADPELVESLSEYEGPMTDFVPPAPKKDTKPKNTGPKLGVGVDQFNQDSTQWELVTGHYVLEEGQHGWVCVGEPPPEARDTDVILGELYGQFPAGSRKSTELRKVIAALSEVDRQALYDDMLTKAEQTGSDANVRKACGKKVVELFEQWDSEPDEEDDDESEADEG